MKDHRLLTADQVLAMIYSAAERVYEEMAVAGDLPVSEAYFLAHNVHFFIWFGPSFRRRQNARWERRLRRME